MSVGKVIRKYRKAKNMTQEEMAGRLGVSAPAVNKWENENSLPDITLLAPIARLLDISPDTLLSFREDLTQEEIHQMVCEADAMLKEKPYDEALAWAKKKMAQYPNCEQLILNMAVIFNAQRLVQEIPNAEEYDDYLCSLYIRVLGSDEEATRIRAADSLIGFYMRKKQYDKAEEYLQYLSVQNPERKRRQAEIYAETDREKEAYKVYEELLFFDYQRASAELHGMYLLALKSKDMERAHMLVNKQRELAQCFEMGELHEIVSGLEIASLEKDADEMLAIMEGMLASLGQISAFRKSPLYEHMEFRAESEEFLEEFKKKVLEGFRDGEDYAFLKGNKRWQELMGAEII
ncbi:helix-turn-helix domain-containing protein [Parablautia muri]|uniref:XRE family transcriptional regulator n=1 Tax=Parablautia muri TaxID=2320879 RepID=A0A9X5GSL5_9FIRM|nr:helix-turn-helix transcriptional regulator [Parablautia muri]NBJ92067.1 XRE family transcriptional regulator [Parablautia muri]